jgi:RimJ/RimL family protein N-acetyltransferase
MLDRDDLPAVQALESACSPREWEHGGITVGEDVAAGTFVGDELAALAGYEVWDGVIAHISVVAHPAHRGRGHAAAAVSLVTTTALERGLLAQYRALESNTPSLAVAERLGFQPYARSVAVRLRGA